MATKDSSEAATSSSHNVSVDSETMIEIKIKTLDSQTHTLRVNKCVPVPLLKEQIATVTGIVSEQQRLICRGKVLKDDERLSAYHVEDGHTLHLVVRQPDQSSSAAFVGHEATNTSSSAANSQGTPVARSIVFEAINIDQGNHEFPNIGQIISSIISSIGAAGLGTHGSRVDVTAGRTTSDDTGLAGSTQLNPNPNSNPAPIRVDLDSLHQVPGRAQPDGPVGLMHPPTPIPDSLTTIFQYIDFMRDEFRRAGYTSNDGGDPFRSIGESSSVGPSVTNLLQALHSTRVLMELSGNSLLQLVSQLVTHIEHVNMAEDPSFRTDLQASAMRSGVLLQNLGSLLLELGRTTMLLRLGQSPIDSMVNSGPAVFISANGPNPLMVQPVPFYPGSSFRQTGTTAAAHTGHGLQGEPLGSLPRTRNIDIHIRTGRAVPVSSSSPPIPGEQANTQVQEQADSMRNSNSNSNSNSIATIPGESSVRVLPIRMVGVPTAVNIPPSNSSGGGIGLIYPVIRVRSRNSGNSSSDVGGENADVMPSSNQEQNQAPNLGIFSAGVIAGSESGQAETHTTSNNSNSQPPVEEEMEAQFLDQVNEWLGRVFGGERQGPPDSEPIPLTQASRDSELQQEQPLRNSEDGVYLSNLLRTVLPAVMQAREGDSQDLGDEGGNSNDSRRSHDESMEGPSAKRQKKD